MDCPTYVKIGDGNATAHFWQAWRNGWILNRQKTLKKFLPIIGNLLKQSKTLPNAAQRGAWDYLEARGLMQPGWMTLEDRCWRKPFETETNINDIDQEMPLSSKCLPLTDILPLKASHPIRWGRRPLAWFGKIACPETMPLPNLILQLPCWNIRKHSVFIEIERPLPGLIPL